MSPEERLKKVQDKLIEQGVKDVKFFFDPTKKYERGATLESAAVTLEAYINGECMVAERYKQKRVGALA